MRKAIILVMAVTGLATFQLKAQDNVPENADKRAKEIKEEVEKMDSFSFSTSLVASLNRTDLYNWATGGQPQTTFNIVWLSQLNKKWDYWGLKASLRTSYGFVKPKDGEMAKTDDYLALSVLAGRNINEKMAFTILADLKTQLTLTKDDTGAVVSALFSPAWLIGAAGFSITHKLWEAFLAPLTMKATFINNRLPMTQRYGVPEGAAVRYEPGAYGIVKFNWAYNAFSVSSRLEMFYNYTTTNVFPDVNWETLFTLKLTKWFGISYFVHTIYDMDIPGPETARTGFSRYLQVKTVLGASLSFTY
ncbi:MAG: DUF3078 domain-containing protein [Chlorobi bacterium]|nr:DUF3078 domain-containing protein [Chlorobiota bacterium]